MSCIVRSHESNASEETPNLVGASNAQTTSTTGLPVPRPALPTLFEEATELYQVKYYYLLLINNMIVIKKTKYLLLLYFLFQIDWSFSRVGHFISRL